MTNLSAQACKTLTVDLITLDLSKKLPFALRRAPVLAAIKRGIAFEISYSGLLDGYAKERFLQAASSRCPAARLATCCHPFAAWMCLTELVQRYLPGACSQAGRWLPAAAVV